MKRILFVDDEVLILEGLQRMLRSQRKCWDVAFATSGEQALALMEKTAFDVIVTDMRMPEMDGSTLLKHVQERFPNVVRIVLSGYFDVDAALRSVPVAHQFLAKPCEPEKLREAIERCCGLKSVLTNETTRRVVGAIGELPSLPRTSASLVQALENPDVPIEEIAAIIERDVAMTAKVLQLVNSAFFGVSQNVSSLRVAVSYLGVDVLRQLVVSVELFHTFQPPRPIAGFSFDRFQQHSRLAAAIAALLPLPKGARNAAIMGALLHDTGRLILAAKLPDQFELVLRTCREDERPLQDVEEELTGTSHAEVGAYLLGLWGLPQSIVDAVCHHHHPQVEAIAKPGLTVSAAVHVADVLACECAIGRTGEENTAQEGLHLEYIEALGVAGEIPEWRALAQEAAKNPPNG